MSKDVLSRDSVVSGPKALTSWVRPIKVAYVVPNDDPYIAVRAIQSCCLSWGGAHSILVPYDNGISNDWVAIMEAYDPDHIVDMAGMPPDTEGPLADLGSGFYAWNEPRSTFLVPGALIYSAAWAFLSKLRPEGMTVLVPQVSPGHPLTLQISARFGSLVDESTIAETIQMHGLDSSIRLDRVAQTLPSDFDNHGIDALLDPPLKGLGQFSGTQALWRLPDLTMLNVHVRPPGWPLVPPNSPEAVVHQRRHASLLLITGADNCVSDLCLYWSLAANRLRADVFPFWLTLNQLRSSEGVGLLNAALARAAPLERRIHGMSNELHVVSTSADSSQIEQVLSATVKARIITTGFGDFVPPMFERGIREEMEVFFDQGHSNLPSPVDDKTRRFGNFDRLCQEIQIKGYQLPQAKELRYSVMGVPWRITQRGFEHSFNAGYADQLTSLYLPSAWDVLEGMLQDHEITPSDKGRLGLGVLNLLGSLDEVRVLRSSKIYGYLALISSRTGRQYLQRQIGDVLGTDFVEQAENIAQRLVGLPTPGSFSTYGEAVTALGKGHARTVLEWLVRKRLLFRGAELECPGCGLRRWYSIEDIGYDFLCGGCQAISASPLELASTNWRYRLNELYVRAFDQGVVVHLLLAYQRKYEELSESRGFLGFFPGLVTVKGGKTAEIDYIEIAGGKLHIAECKNDAANVTSDQVEKLAGVASDIACSGLSFASASGTLAPDLAECLVSRAGPRVEVYGAEDLFDRDPWDRQAQLPDAYLDKIVRTLQID